MKKSIEGNYAGVSFKDQDMADYTFRGNFTGADFTNTTLTNADLSRGIFQDADFDNANAQGANLKGGAFLNANLTYSNSGSKK